MHLLYFILYFSADLVFFFYLFFVNVRKSKPHNTLCCLSDPKSETLCSQACDKEEGESYQKEKKDGMGF